MAATALRSSAPTTNPPMPGRRFDHAFFSGMAVLMLATVLVGFAPTYYLAGLWNAPLPSRIIEVHGAVFSCWILLLLAQTTLASTGRLAVHRRLGIAGVLLACAMAIMGVLAAIDALDRGIPPHGDAAAFFIVPLSAILLFTTLAVCGFERRADPAAHKRLMLLATIALMGAPIARLHLAVVYRQPHAADRASETFLLLLLAYDLWSTRKVHRATLGGAALVALVHELTGPIGTTAAWHGIAGWARSLPLR